ncbi:MAG: glutathione S-transferase family protein [Halioglobus sp.]
MTGPEQSAVNDSCLPITLYGPELSYFTGKLEAVIRFMELPYQRLPAGPMSEEPLAAGVAQVPAVRLADKRWMTDSTPIIGWLHDRYPRHQVIPTNPVLRFFSLLLEDYADEWLWRPAMHYRWDYAEGAALQGRVLIDENAHDMPLPGALKRYLIRNRQRKLFTRGDGVGPDTWDHVEKTYLDTLAQFKTVLADRPYLLGTRPSLADFGFFGPMFRHFSMDPTSARIMRETAPSVYEWVARVWNARSSGGGELLDTLPADWQPIMHSIGATYLPYLVANANAWSQSQERFDAVIEGVNYRNLRTAPYRVWCLEQLRGHYDSLSDADKITVRPVLENTGCWQPLWDNATLASQIDPDQKAPFGGGGSMTGVSLKSALKINWMPAGKAHSR